ncbi:carotenoid biosynthesis protein [Bacillus sp. 165]|uniref:carotenoid biosynthesis protein n=1 Tax=Bacillus sp. 165 TaxID=1529117 RepID=UPI001AD98C3A|nr:carotenoid biosynthesis protein [Bacillus sp. 165]MBO9128685.1 carotenoid biosynthesis protein [Bacillus sp. 165]
MNWENYVFRFFLIWYACGVILLSLNILPPWLEWANAVFLILSGTLGAIYWCKSYGVLQGGIVSAIIFLASMIAEYTGTTYGWIFGKYFYQSDFGPQILGIPITIGFAWLIVISTSHALIKRMMQNRSSIIYIFLGGVIAVGMDLIIDPVAFVAKQYWIWEKTGPYYNIPIQNFLGWFFVAAFLHLFIYFYLQKYWHQEDSAWHTKMIVLYILVIFMFILLAFIAKLYLAVCITSLYNLPILIYYFRQRRVNR